MTLEELIEKLKQIAESDAFTEEAHIEADGLLLEYINDERVKEAFNSIDKWYA